MILALPCFGGLFVRSQNQRNRTSCSGGSWSSMIPHPRTPRRKHVGPAGIDQRGNSRKFACYRKLKQNVVVGQSSWKYSSWTVFLSWAVQTHSLHDVPIISNKRSLMHSYPRHSATQRPLIIARPALDKIHFIRDDSQSALCTAANRAYMPFQMFIVQLSSYNTPVEWRTAVENLNMFLLCWQSTLQPAQPSCPLLYDVGRMPSNSENAHQMQCIQEWHRVYWYHDARSCLSQNKQNNIHFRSMLSCIANLELHITVIEN